MAVAAGEILRVLELDRDLAAGLSGEERERATDVLVARVFDAPAGPWQIRTPQRGHAAFGLLVVDGVLGLHTTLEGRTTLELVGRGDLLQPWVRLEDETTMPPAAAWEVLEPARVVLLDRAFGERVAEWPEIVARLMYRLVFRSRRLCYQLVVNASPRADDRVLYTLWALADRWGRVTEEGVVLKLGLTHLQIGELISAQRPSASAALSRLREDGRIAYSRGRYVLCGEPPPTVSDLKRQVALKP